MSEYVCLDPPRMGTYTVERIQPSIKTDTGLNKPLYDVWTTGHIQMGLRVIGDVPKSGDSIQITGWAMKRIDTDNH